MLMRRLLRRAVTPLKRSRRGLAARRDGARARRRHDGGSQSLASKATTVAATSEAAGLPKETQRGGSKRLRALWELSKPELSALTVTTGGWGFLLSGCESIAAGGYTVGGLVACAASAAALNQISEVPYDGMMTRTRSRPLPSGRLSMREAQAFALAAGVGGVGMLGAGATPLAGALGLSNILLYWLAYTPMKRWSPYNTHVGAVVGALPVVIGWAGGGGALLATEPAVLFGLLYAWQFPHFMAIAWKYRKDYKGAGYRMVTRDDPGAERTARWALNGAIAICATPFVTTFAGMSSCMYLVSSAPANLALLASCFKFKAKPTAANANKLIGVGFIHIMIFLALLFFHSTSDALERHCNSVRNNLRAAGLGFCVHETTMSEAPGLCIALPNSEAPLLTKKGSTMAAEVGSATTTGNASVASSVAEQQA